MSRKILLIISKNNIDELRKIENNELISNNYLEKAIKKQSSECFDYIINLPNINLNDSIYSDCFIEAYKLYKNDPNSEYISKLLDRNIYIDSYDLPKLINYNIDIYYKYVNDNINDNIYINVLLNKLQENKYMQYFYEVFDKLNEQNKMKYIKNNIYNNASNDVIFMHFLKLEEYDYNTITSYDKIRYNLINIALNSKNAELIECIVEYLKKKPFDMSDLINLSRHQTLQLLGCNPVIKKLTWKKLIKPLKEKLVINSIKFDLLKIIINECSRYHQYIVPRELYLYYIYHKIGINLDIYNNFTTDELELCVNKLTNFGLELKDNMINSIITIVQFSRFIGQNIPDHLRESIYRICNYSRLLDVIPTEKDIWS